MTCSRNKRPTTRRHSVDFVFACGTARRDRTCLLLLVTEAQSLDCQRRGRSRWIACESNAVQAPYQRAQGDQPSRSFRATWRAERESNPHLPFCRRASSPRARLISIVGADKGNRTPLIGLEDRFPTTGYPRCPLGGWWSRPELHRQPLRCHRSALLAELRPHSVNRWNDRELHPDHCRARAVFSC